LNAASSEFNPDGAFGFQVEFVPSESCQKIGFTLKMIEEQCEVSMSCIGQVKFLPVPESPIKTTLQRGEKSSNEYQRATEYQSRQLISATIVFYYL
jgi:hypothetical protein